MQPPRACIDCATEPGPGDGLRSERCGGCGRALIVCSDGACWPYTGMGCQAAEWHEHGLRAPAPRTRLRHRALIREWPLPGGRALSVFPLTVVVSQCDEYADGTRSTWYPVHFTLRRGRPRLQIRRTSPQSAKRPGERPLRTVRR